jgi:tripartite-type tricarboxylate transporter receptor subunit TctC
VLVVRQRAGKGRAGARRADEREAAEFQYASSGIGSTQHIAGIGFATVTATAPCTFPTRAAPGARRLDHRRVQMMLDTTSSAMPQIKAGSSPRSL